MFTKIIGPEMTETAYRIAAKNWKTTVSQINNNISFVGGILDGRERATYDKIAELLMIIENNRSGALDFEKNASPVIDELAKIFEKLDAHEITDMFKIYENRSYGQSIILVLAKMKNLTEKFTSVSPTDTGEELFAQNPPEYSSPRALLHKYLKSMYVIGSKGLSNNWAGLTLRDNVIKMVRGNYYVFDRDFDTYLHNRELEFKKNGQVSLEAYWKKSPF